MTSPSPNPDPSSSPSPSPDPSSSPNPSPNPEITFNQDKEEFDRKFEESKKLLESNRNNNESSINIPTWGWIVIAIIVIIFIVGGIFLAITVVNKKYEFFQANPGAALGVTAMESGASVLSNLFNRNK